MQQSYNQSIIMWNIQSLNNRIKCIAYQSEPKSSGKLEVEIHVMLFNRSHKKVKVSDDQLKLRFEGKLKNEQRR